MQAFCCPGSPVRPGAFLGARQAPDLSRHGLRPLIPHGERSSQRPRPRFEVAASAAPTALDPQQAALHLLRELSAARRWEIELAEFEGLRGMKPRRVLKRGAEVARVPEAYLIDMEKGLFEELPYDHFVEHVSTALFILLHRLRAESAGSYAATLWGPYLVGIPYDAFDDFPCHWSDAELEMLRGSRALQRAQDAKALYGTLHKHISQALRKGAGPFPRDWFTPARLAWALNAVSSRCFGRESRSGLPEMVMVPGGDLLNHEARAPGPNVSWGFEEGSGDLVVRAARDLTPAQQAMAFYGAHPNAHLLVECGFAIEGNSHDLVEVKLGIRAADPLRDAKLKAAKACLRDADAKQLTGLFELRAGPLPANLARFAALATAQSADAVAALEKRLKGGALDAASEARVRQALSIVLAARLKQYTLEGAPGEGPEAGVRGRMAGVVVEGEKAILVGALQQLLGNAPLL
eukprot:tig00001374_g8499.t1